jgi:hypothetical protein
LPRQAGAKLRRPETDCPKARMEGGQCRDGGLQSRMDGLVMIDGELEILEIPGGAGSRK